MLAGIKDILIISTPEDTPRMEALLGNGSHFGLNITYKIQPSPDGLAQAFILGEEFIGDDSCCMILGDNILYGNGLKKNLLIAKNSADQGESTIFGYYVNDPERFGVVEFNNDGKAISIEEKPIAPKSNYAVIGLYFYPKGVSKNAKSLKPSKRGELEITDLNKLYLNENTLNVLTLGRGITWLDAGTYDSLAEATSFVKMIEEHQGLMISSPEEIAFNNGWISKEKLLEIGKSMAKNSYGKHLINVAEGKILY